MVKLIIFILIVLIIAALLIRIILRSVNQHSPLLMQLHGQVYGPVMQSEYCPAVNTGNVRRRC